MIILPATRDEALRSQGEFRAGGTDLMDRIRIGKARAAVVDLRDVTDLGGVTDTPDGGLRVGTRVSIAALAADPRVRQRYPGLAAAAGGLATPAIRAIGTVGGNLLQRVRCWYFRHADETCLKSGGGACRARAGDAHHHSCYDLGPCIAPHPSTLAMAFQCWDAQVELDPGGIRWTLEQVYGDGADPTREHRLPHGTLMTSVILPAAGAGERSAWVRLASRARAEWPMVEAVARLTLSESGAVQAARIGLGGVANIPLRATAAEGVLSGAEAGPAAFSAAGAAQARMANPVPHTAWKVPLVAVAIEDVLARAMESAR